jgi:hypothetical protein
MTYTVSYKRNSDYFWKKIKCVKGDGVLQDNRLVRYFICDDESRYEIPMESTVFKFSKERFTVILKNMEKESGQKISV